MTKSTNYSNMMEDMEACEYIMGAMRAHLMDDSDAWKHHSQYPILPIVSHRY